MLHGDELTRDERAAAADPSGAKPRLRGDAVLMLAEDRLQLGGGSCEPQRGAAHDRGHRLHGVSRTLGQDADAMELGVSRGIRQLPDG